MFTTCWNILGITFIIHIGLIIYFPGKYKADIKQPFCELRWQTTFWLVTEGGGKWLNARAYASVCNIWWSVIRSAWETDGSHQLCSIHFDHVDSSLPISVSLTCSSQCCWLVQQRLCHVLSCLFDNACKRSLVFCLKSRALCPISRLLPVPISCI